MAYELKEGQGMLFPNDKKKSDKAPLMRGEAMINGVLMEISAWTKVSQSSGMKFLSLAVKPKQNNYQNNGGQQRQYRQPANNNHQYQQTQPQPQYQAPAQQGEGDDDLPF